MPLKVAGRRLRPTVGRDDWVTLKIVGGNDAGAIIKSAIDAGAVVASYFSASRERAGEERERGRERRREIRAECRERATGSSRAISSGFSAERAR